jgi:hypothetical protein
MDHFIDTLNKVVIYYHSIPAGFWQVLIASGILSPLIKAWKHFRITKKEKQIGEIAMYAITVGVAFVAATLQYLFTKHPQDPSIIALHTAVLGFVLTPTYLLAVKPLWAFLSNKFGEAATLEQQLKSAEIPAGGLPVEGTSVSASDAQAALHSSITTDDFTH